MKNYVEFQIAAIKAVPYNFQLKKPFVIASGEFYTMPGAIIQVALRNGIYGYGEAQAFETLTNEDSTTIIEAVSKIGHAIVGRNIFDIAKIIAECEQLIPRDRAAMCGIDMAVYDAAGKASDLPVSFLLGGMDAYPVEVNAVLSMQEKDALMHTAKTFLKNNFRVFKVKVGKDFKKELEFVGKVRELIGKNLLFIDANTGWSDHKLALRYINAFARYNIAWVEQPLQHDNIKGLQWLVSHSPVPIMLDESLYTPEDTYKLIAAKATDMINVKLSKSGGLYNALRIAAIAQASGKEIMLGSNLESPLGCLAGYQFAKAVKCVTTAMASYLLLESDFDHPMVVQNGQIEVRERSPGLGYGKRMEDQLKKLFL